ncbi:sensor domain-containing diguanylate cyclase [Filomicrobium sp.]|uniref:sensor domain-containing diguanylate cyclase n=1 Tax=Filomicrobium sp. TaxID=2024831 RepID=UPI002586483D|nr:sensor domain-containing diguanylate cyclase [Filomicrobium sp.]
MAAFMSSQLDFIYFFYGLAFLLLGAVSVTIARGHRGGPWLFLAAFGFTHGVVEWLDLIAFTIFDHEIFTSARVALLAISYALLLEFARLEGQRLGAKVPGPWIYVPVAMIVVAAWLSEGTGMAIVFARYTLAIPGAALAALAFAWNANKVTGGQKVCGYAAAAGFLTYAVVAGLVVPVAPVWPASVVNEDWFADMTGVPVQLIRGAVAYSIALSIWGLWGERLIEDLSTGRYTTHFQRQIVGTLAALTIVLLSGWALTEYLGSVYKKNTEAETSGELDLIASRFNGDAASVIGMVQVVAGAPDVQKAVVGISGNEKRILNLAVEATGAKLGYIINPAGRILATSGREQAALTSARNFPSSRCFYAAMKGQVAQGIIFDNDTGSASYYASSPIFGEWGQIVSVAVLEKPLSDFIDDLRRYDRPFYLVDPNGVVVLTNRPEMRYRTMWPVRDAVRAQLQNEFPDLQDKPLLSRSLSEGRWASIDGERAYVKRRFIHASDWSLVIIRPVQEVFASRMLGIVITLFMMIATLIYALGRGWSIQDSIQMMKRLELQKLASELKLSAITDPLTGLNNRRRFNEVLSLEMMRSQRYGTPLSLVLYDIDHFKNINDSHGHLVGDKVLIQLSDLIADRIRGTDILARWGGEEFAILLPGADESMAQNLTESLRDLISDVTFDDVGKLTCSFGIAQYRGEANMEDFMGRADAALYRAKFNGRNRIEIHNSSTKRRLKANTAA